MLWISVGGWPREELLELSQTASATAASCYDFFEPEKGELCADKYDAVLWSG